MYAAEIHEHRSELHAAQELEEELFTLSYEQGFSYWSTEGAIRHAWTASRQGQLEEGLAQMHQPVAALQARGEEIAHPYALYRLADVYGRAGNPEEGLRIVTQGLVIASQQGRMLWEVNFHCQKGNLILQQESQESKGNKQKTLPMPNLQPVTPSTQEAETCSLKSIEIAQRQQAKSWELRATVSLARPWQSQGKHHDARNLVSEIYNWFTEGFDTKDLQEARALLEELL
jgi:adenylate cyclase